MSESNPNLEIWSVAQKTDPTYTKDFKKAGGQTGTSINAAYMAKRATEQFGPMGIGWGVDIVDEDYKEGAIRGIDDKTGAPNREIVHVLRVRLWFKHGDEKGEIFHFGQTTFVGVNKYGPYTDEEAPKKSLTDATTKALSMLGFGGDVFLGQYDDAEYRAEISEDFGFAKEETNEEEAKKRFEEFVAYCDRWLGQLENPSSENELKINYAQGLKVVERYERKTGKQQPDLREKAQGIYRARRSEYQQIRDELTEKAEEAKE